LSQNKTSRRSSSGSMEKTLPIILLGALGVGVAYWLYKNGGEELIGSGSSGSFGSGDFYDMIGGGAATASPVQAAAGAGASAASVAASTGAGDYSGSAGVRSSYIADVKKSSTLDLSGNYQALTTADINSLNQQLAALYDAEGRSQSAFNFVAIPSNAVAAATIKNTGISNAGSNLTSIVNNDGSYAVYDWRGNIVSSGSAGAFQGSTVTSSGSSGSSSGSSKKAASVSSSSSSSGITGSKNTVNIIADKNSVIRSSSSGVKVGTVKGKTAVSSGSSSGSSSSSKKAASVSSSSGYAMGGAVRSNTTAGKYTG